jgi:phenylalanyl-tRNA synthetase beta chain
MRVSVKWLKDYVNLAISPSELARRLTMAGNEVKAVETTGVGWEDKVVIGQIKAVNPHPNADRLRLATVDLGAEERTVVCGAPNLHVGDKIVFAAVGAHLRDGHTGELAELKQARIRGVESAGMICSEKELGLSDNHEVILVLPAEAPVGTRLLDYMGDSVIDLDVTPNRPDCLSVIGIAREAAALTDEKVNLAEPQYKETGAPIEEKIVIEIRAPDLCRRYTASLVTGVKIKPSPGWMQDRLVASGMRPINNVVDISNYVMLEYGQPLHTFDYDRIAGRKIIVRRAAPGENIISLDGMPRSLTTDMLVIADADRAVAVAGVMGGANSEVTEQTDSILVEAANFAPLSIRRTGEALNMTSEARYRFERGISPDVTLVAMKRATQLLAELGDGTIAKGYIDLYPGQMKVNPIALSIARLRKLLGAEFSKEQITKTLLSLGFSYTETGGDTLQVTAPYWRSDVHIEEDLIEEVARIIGYDKIPMTLLSDLLPSGASEPIFSLRRFARDTLAATGFVEVLNFSMTGADMMSKITGSESDLATSAVRIANPMTADMEFLRTSLRATLLSAFAANRRFEEGGVRLFESGKIYLRGSQPQPDERDMICGVMGGQRLARSWQDHAETVDFYDTKGIVETFFMRLGLTPVFTIGNDAALHPNKQAEIILENQKVGVVGEVHPMVAAKFEIIEPVFLLEIDLKSLLPFTALDRLYEPLPRFPAIVRDLALITDASLLSQAVREAIKGFPLVDDVEIFDVYAGEQVPAGKKSLAYRVSYRSPTHTLTDEEVNAVQSQIVSGLSAKFGATLRG